MPQILMKNILNDGIICSDNKKNIELKEADRSATLKEIKIKNIPEHSILLRMDKVKSDTLFKSGKGPNKRCDYVIFSKGMEKNKVVFIEIKSSLNSDSKIPECIEKFKAVECVFDYCDSVIYKIYENKKIFDRAEKHFVLLYQAPPIQKTTTTIQKHDPNTSPENLRAIPVKNSGELNYLSLI